MIADISGYTAFLTGNELEHADGIIQDLTKGVLASFTPPWKLVKLEGDAAFFLGPAEYFADAERIFEAIERAYFDFADLRDDMQRSTTCQCSACSNIATLDLKFVSHFGGYLPQRLASVEDVAGPDVIVVHRLLKNHVREQGGVQAYALITQAVVSRMKEAAPALEAHAEEFEGVGEISGVVEDLARMRGEFLAARRVYVSAEEADYSTSWTVPLPPEIAWQYWVEPEKRARWSETPTIRSDPNSRGRLGAGASYHCAHGRGISLSRYLDWRPFDYSTTEKTTLTFSLTAPPAMVDTCELKALGPNETELTYRFRLKNRSLASRWRVKLIKPMLDRMFARDREKGLAAVAEDLRAIGQAAASEYQEAAL